MEFDLVEKYFRFRSKGVISGRELVGRLFDQLAYDGDFGQVVDVANKLMVQDETAILDWLHRVEPRYNDPRWAPFWPGQDGQLEHNRRMRDNFRRVAELVQSAIENRPSVRESEGIKG